ncbi:MAG: hypothetical protein JXR56_04225 [Candidatus Cloacimonetes bacterium]|nr:hypothetical protein [Candidatus Cloacimonadota bacterium]
MMSILNEKGNLTLALVLVLISILSAMTLALFVYADTANLTRNMEYMQEKFLMRSEIERGFKVLERNLDIANSMILPTRRIIITGSHYARTYDTTSKIEAVTIGDSKNSQPDRYSIIGFARSRGKNHNSPVHVSQLTRESRYTTAEVIRLSLAGFHDFNDIGLTTNDTSTRYWGGDVIRGRVHSNSNINIEAGGNNEYNGIWPCFFSKVTTAGVFQWPDGMGTADLIFRGGYEEEVQPIELPTIAMDVRQFGHNIYTGNGPSSTIFVVEVTGSTWNAMVGNVQFTGIDSMWHYTVDPGGYIVIDSTVYNIRTIKDTIWTSGGGGSIVGSAGMVYNAKLWIRGSFGGLQTWACEDTIFLIGDIKLAGTNLGEIPVESPANMTDCVGIVSEKNIEVKYGYCDPFQSPNGAGFYPRVRPNCEDGGIYIYASLCALGDGEGNPNYDGVFTIEYQHPHRSTPDAVLPYLNASGNVVDTLMTMLDLHGFHNTGVAGWVNDDTFIPLGTPGNNSWPGNLDYPFYNPLWPELLPYRERGNIYLWGSVIQRRRGYTHRSDSSNPNRAQNCWDFDNENVGIPQYGSLVTSQNLPHSPSAVSTTGEGYIKVFRYDERLDTIIPPCFPRSNRLIFVDFNKLSTQNAYHQNDD